MKTKILGLDGKAKETIDLPKVFETRHRPDVIKRAVLSIESSRRQPKGTYPLAGLQTTAVYIGRRAAYRSGINRAMARLPKIKLPEGRHGDVRRVPQAVKGRRSHPPKKEKNLKEKINKKESTLALKSAIAATANKELVEKRGHKLAKNLELPLIVDSKLETIKKTKQVSDVFEKIGIGEDLIRAEKGKKIRAGRGTTRGRKYKKTKGPLLVVAEDQGIIKAARNIEGVDVVRVQQLNAKDLAPGCLPGRLTVWTKSAVEKFGERK